MTTNLRSRTIADVLDAARRRLRRLTPAEARNALGRGAVLVDIRPAAQRAEHGEVPEALVIERNVLEWRFDPHSEAALPIARHDLEVMVLCQEGYTSSLAAVALQDLGIWRATDVIGGHAALTAEWSTLKKEQLADSSVQRGPLAPSRCHERARVTLRRRSAGRKPAG